LVIGYDKTASHWAIAGRPSYGPSEQSWFSQPYAKTDGSSDQSLDSLSGKTWTGVAGDSGQLGARSGEELRQKVKAFAKQQKVDIKEIYMVDGSHLDARANAFVGGMDGSIIGLYDTLFLGDHSKNYQANDASGFFFMLNGKSGIRKLSEKVQSVDVSGEDDQEVWSSAPTQAMTDNEIVAILAHELAHVSEHHMEQSLVVQASTALVTFATLGWVAHSPLLAVGLGLTAPLLWVGACTYDHLVGPPLDTTLKLFTDWHTRHGEYQADAYVASLSETYATALQTSLAKLSVNANQDPDYPVWYEALHDDHPTVAHRWQAIEDVKQEKYSK
jgi:Zn-dependent protease with chaperone function